MSALGQKRTLRLASRCLLYPRKRTSVQRATMSALCQKRKSVTRGRDELRWIKVGGFVFEDVLGQLQHIRRDFPSRASETQLVESWSISSTILPSAMRAAGKRLRIQTNWTRIPLIPSMIHVAMIAATTVPLIMNRSANALLTPCAIMTPRAPAARCARTKNAPSQ